MANGIEGVYRHFNPPTILFSGDCILEVMGLTGSSEETVVGIKIVQARSDKEIGTFSLTTNQLIQFIDELIERIPKVE